MKAIFKYVCYGVLSMSLASCDGLLDKEPLDKYTADDVWNNVNLAQGFIYNVYNSVLPELLITPLEQDKRFQGLGGDDFTDNVLMYNAQTIALNTIDVYFDAGWATNNNNVGKENSFEVIRDCNLIIENVAKSEEIEESQKPGLIAQGKLLRALMYWNKARMFGKYVVVDKVLSPGDELQLPRTATIKDTYDFILKDLQEAADDLPLAEDVKTGHLTKGVAYAFLAEVALHGAAYIEEGKTDYWLLAKQASEDLFDLSYELEDDYAGLFSDYDVALSSKEIILTRLRHIDVTKGIITTMQGIIPNMEFARTKGVPALNESFRGWSMVWPTCDLIDDYLVNDTTGEAVRWYESSYYQAWENGAKAPESLIKAIYNEHRDARFESSIMHDDSKINVNTLRVRDGGNMDPYMSLKGTGRSTRTGYWVRKGLYHINAYVPGINTNYHQNIARLGRSYLNYAEVMLRLGEVSKAIEYINKTRVTHGQLPPLDPDLSAEEAWKWYKIERRVELFFENDRYWSLLRWGKEDGLDVIPELNKKNWRYFNIKADGNDYEWKNVWLGVEAHQRSFSKRRYLYPVPHGERILNEKYDQNPDW